MSAQREEWRRFVAKAAVLSVMVMVAAFVGNKLANAGPGVVGGSPRTYVTVSGTITPLTGTQHATFHFHVLGVTTDLCAPQVDVAVGGGGAFSVEVPLDQGAAGTVTRCPDTMFNGGDVQVDVDLPGAPGVVLNANVNPVPYALYASQYGTPDCPVGYERNRVGGDAPFVVCRRTRVAVTDEVVRVGSGASAFWIDRYEATIWTAGDGRALSERTDTDLSGPGLGLPHNGDWVGQTSQLLALSVSVRDFPSRYVTWFQAQELCRASGKRLPTGDEWLSAARGTLDTGCQIARTNTFPRNTSDGTSCVSAWGAQDMIGNLWEWTAEWYAGTVGDLSRDECRAMGSPCGGWPDDYYGDATWNIAGGVANSIGGTRNANTPAAALRGGNWNDGTLTGRFALRLDQGPSSWNSDIGFRCVIPR